MGRPERSLLRAVQTWGVVLAISSLAGIAFHLWAQYRQALLQGYEATLEAPLTARADILPLYARSPFRKMEIEFPPAEIAERFVLRVWVEKSQSSQDVEGELKRFLERFYTTSQTRIDMRLSSMELELSALQAAQRAKVFEMDYLQQHYAQLRSQRIAQLHDEVKALGGAMEDRRNTILSVQNANSVTIRSFEVVASNRLATALVVQSLLVGLFVALLQMLWLQRKYPGDASF
jgi:hypothetical protein